MSTFENHIRDIVREELAQTDEFLTITEAAKVMGVSRSWLYQARHHKNPDQPPSYGAAGVIRYKRSELLAWIEASRREVRHDG
jgi:predicted DNA-binding transcriptional regulator AlpA